MIRISLPFVYNLAEKLETLSALQAGQQYNNWLFQLFEARFQVDVFLNQSVFSPYLRICRDHGVALLGTLDAGINNNTDRELDMLEVFSVTQRYGQFKTTMLAELGVLPSFFVTQKGGFDTNTLLEAGQMLFPEELQAKVPEAFFDCTEAAKALAYEVPTAAGFHIFRATEAVLRRYYAEVSGGTAAPKVRTIKVYVRKMQKEKWGEEIILKTLEQMADLYRNPLSHPEAILTMDEAIGIVGIARSAVTAMLKALPVPLPTTGAG